jgi:putative transposase
MPVPDGINQRWSVDFIGDQLANGRRFRVFSAIDDFSRECVVQITDFSISGERWVRELDQLARTRSLPGAVILDNGPELTSKAMFSGQSAPESNCTSSNMASLPRMPLLSLLMANSVIPV